MISRIEQPCLVENWAFSDDTESKAADLQWSHFVVLQAVLQPSFRYPETIAHEYGFQNGELMYSVRAAVTGYVLRRWNVTCSENHAHIGSEYHLWYKNRQTLTEIDNPVLAPGYSATHKETRL